MWDVGYLTSHSLFLIESQCRRVHAVAQSGGLGAVREDVAQMAFAAGTEHLGAPHAVTVVGYLFHRALGEGLIEAGPAGAGLKLRLGAEQLLSTARAAVDAVLMVVP